jgi:hypothetical protein
VGLVLDDVDPDGAKQRENAAGFGGARQVVIAGDHDHRRVGERGAKPGQFAEREQDHRVGGAHLMKDIAGDQDQVGGGLNDGVDGMPGGPRDVGLALVVTRRAQPLVLAEAKVEVGEVGDAHGGKVGERRTGGRPRSGQSGVRYDTVSVPTLTTYDLGRT